MASQGHNELTIGIPETHLRQMELIVDNTYFKKFWQRHSHKNMFSGSKKAIRSVLRG